jgi:aminoglycoside phosphotransferase
LRRLAFLLRASDRDAARYFVRRIAFAYREPGDAGVRARLQQTRSRAALLAPATLALRGAPGRLAVLPGPEMPPSQLEAVGDLVLGSWTALELPGRPPNWLAPLVVGHRRPTTGMVTVLLFRDGDRVPTVVAKLPRYSSNGTTMRREEEALEAVRLVLDGAVRDAVPRSLGIHDVDGTEVLLQTGIPGRHLVAETASGRLRPSALAKQIELVLDWCLTMQAASCRMTVVDDALIAGSLEPLAADGLAALDRDPRVGSLLDQTLEQARNLRGTSLPMVVCHGDYWAGNMLVDRGRVSGVVD